MTLINSFVFFGTKPHFHIQGKSKFPSCLNHLLSVIYICCFFLVFLSYLIKLVSQKNLSIATTIFKDISPLLINISDPNFVFTFGLQYKNYSNFIDETLYHVKGYFIQIYKDENNNTTKTKTPINLVPCSKVYIPVLPNYFNKLPLDQLYCINEKRNLYLEGSISTTNWSYIEFDFSRCRGNDCKKETEIDNILTGGYIGFFMSDYFANPSDHESPAKLSGSNYYSGISISLYNELWLYFQTIQFETDDNWFYSSNKTQQYFSSEKQFTFQDHREIQDIFLKVYLRASESRYIYYRKYGKFDEIIAKVYCLWRTCGFVLNLIVYYFEGLLYKSFLCSFYSFNYGQTSKKCISSANNIINNNINNNAKITSSNDCGNNNINNIPQKNSQLKTSHMNLQQGSYISGNEKNNLMLDYFIKKSHTLKNSVNNQQAQSNEKNHKQKEIISSSNNTNKEQQNSSHEQIGNINSSNYNHQLQILPQYCSQKPGSYLSSLFRKRDMVKQPKEYGYTTNSFVCYDLIKFCLCSPSEVRKVHFVQKSARNVKIFFDIVRYLKLYSDVDTLLRTVFEDKQWKQIERSYNFIKNSEFTVKFFSKDFKTDKKNNQKNMIQNIFFSNSL